MFLLFTFIRDVVLLWQSGSHVQTQARAQIYNLLAIRRNYDTMNGQQGQ